MKRIMILFLLTVFGAVAAWGQEERHQYLFPEFQSGRVSYKDGRIFNVRLNYSLVSNRFVFIDASDKDTIKEIGEIERVANITIAGRTFLIVGQGEACEVVQFEKPKILAEYRGKFTDRGGQAAYGGRSQVASSSSFSSFESEGLVYQLEGDDRWVITGIEITYQVENKGRMRTFSNMRQFLKIYPKDYAAAIEGYAVDNAVDFETVEQVVDLCNLASSLD